MLQAAALAPVVEPVNLRTWGLVSDSIRAARLASCWTPGGGGGAINMCLLPPTHNPRPDPHMQYEYVIASLSIARAFFGFFRLLTSKALLKHISSHCHWPTQSATPPLKRSPHRARTTAHRTCAGKHVLAASSF